MCTYDIYEHFSDLFSSHAFDIGRFKDVKHRIFTTCNYPIRCQTRRIPMAYQKQVDEMIEELLKNDIIVPSSSPWNSPIVIVPKRNGQLRLCLDYRRLNSVTERNVFHIPAAQEIFDCLGGNSCFSTLDLSKGYYQIAMDEDSAEKTAFSTPSGHYQFTRMPFGLNGAPATFQDALTHILKDEIGKHCCIYLDDIIIFGKSRKIHNQRLVNILTKLRNAGLKLSKEKCEFLKDSVIFLGHLIDSSGIKPDPSKIEKIKNWQLPCLSKQLHTFIGFAGYYRRFIKNYSEIVRPLEEMLERDGHKIINKELKWTDIQKNSFETMKTHLCNATTLAFPDENASYILDTDASHDGIAGVLSQKFPNGEERVLHFASHKLSKEQKNYCTTRKELYAVVKYLKFFRDYLLGRKFVIRSDHKSLTWLLNWSKPNSSQYYTWIEDISMFTFDIQHRKGSEHVNADALSRLPQCGQCEIKHTEPKKRRNTKLLRTLEEQGHDELAKISKYITEKQENNLSKETIANAKSLALWKHMDKLTIKGNKLLLKEKDGYKIVLSENDGRQMTQRYHSSLAHIGYSKLFNTLRSSYFWNSMKSDIYDVCTSCEWCRQRKRSGTYNMFKGSLLSEYPFQKVFVDISGPFPISKGGFKWLLSIVDGFSKWPVLVPLKSETAAEVAKALFKSWIIHYGAPEEIHSDRGGSFTSDIILSLCQLLKIKKTFTSPYYPQSNGQCERLFQTIKDMFFCLHKELKCDWVEALPYIHLSLRKTTLQNQKLSPFEMIFGHSMNLPYDEQIVNREISIPFDKGILTKMIKCSLKAANGKRDKYVYENKFHIGDCVYAKILPRRKDIYKPNYEGPYKVIDIKGGGCIYLKHILTGREIIRNVHHIKRVSYVTDKRTMDMDRQYIVNEAIQLNQPQDNNKETTTRKKYPKRSRNKTQKYGFDE